MRYLVKNDRLITAAPKCWILTFRTSGGGTQMTNWATIILPWK